MEAEFSSLAPSTKRGEFEEVTLPSLDALRERGLRLTGGDESRPEALVLATIRRAWESGDSYELDADCRAWLLAILRDTFEKELRDRGEEASVPGIAVEDGESGGRPASNSRLRRKVERLVDRVAKD